MISAAAIGYLTIGLCLATMAALLFELLRHTLSYLEGREIPDMPRASLNLMRATLVCLPVALWVLN